MSQFFDLSGFVLGVLGCGIFQILCSIFFDCLPKNRLKTLERTFEEAYTLFRCGTEEGLIQAEYEELKEGLKCARRDLNTIRNKVMHLATFWEQVRALFSSFSRKMNHIDRSIRALREKIVSTSDKAKIELEARGYQYDPCMSPLEVTLLGARCPSTRTYTTVTGIDQADVVTNDQVPPPQGLQSTSSETLTVSATLSQSPSPSILFPSLRPHCDSMSSVSTSSTAVDGEELNAPSQKPMFPSFKIDNRNTVGAIITSRLLKNDHTRLQQSIIFSEEPETYSVPSVSHKLDSLQHCSDAFSLAMLRQRHNYINVEPLSVSKTLLSKVPNPWFRPRTSHLLPI